MICLKTGSGFRGAWAYHGPDSFVGDRYGSTSTKADESVGNQDFLRFTVAAIAFTGCVFATTNVWRSAAPRSAPQSRRPADTREVSLSDVGSDWPLTVSSGKLKCTNNAVTFIDGATIDALNGAANELSYAIDGAPIWAADPAGAGLKKDIRPLIDRGLKVCN